MIKIIITILALLWPALSMAVTYTVNSKTAFTSAVNSVGPGDTITISNGTYTNWGAITISHTQDGTAVNPITIKAQTEGSVIFSGQGALNLDIRAAYWTVTKLKWKDQTSFGSYLSTGASGGSLITLDGAQHVILDDLTFENIGGEGVVIPVMKLNGTRNTTDNWFQNSTITGYYQPLNKATFIYVYGQSNRGFPTGFHVKGNTFTSRSITSTVRDNHWFRMGNGDVSYDSNSSFEYNTVGADTMAVPRQEVIHVEAKGFRVVGNTFTGTAGLFFRRGTGDLITRNTFISPNSVYTDYQVKVFDSGHEILNNLCYATNGAKMCWHFGMGSTDVGGDGELDYTEFKNSTFAHNTIDGFVDTGVQMEGPDSGSNDGVTTVYPNGNTFVDNAIRQTVGVMVRGQNCSSGAFAAISHNAYSGAAGIGCLSESTNDITSSPNWVSPASGNYNPANASPLIDSGTSTGLLQARVDREGRLRDTSPDIGACEFDSGISVAPPSPTACNDLYGTASDYLLCEQLDLTCEFNVTLNGQSCDDLCGVYGKSCVTAYSNAAGSCTRAGADVCSTATADQLCVCELNDSADAAPAFVTRYVDSRCGTQGDGTTQTCGANGPWTSLKYALETADCAGMSPGSTLSILATPNSPSSGNWYTNGYYGEGDIVPDDACSGIIIEHGDYSNAVIDGSLNIAGSTWTQQGTSNVYECTGGTCGPSSGFPFTAWYDRGSGQEQLFLVQSVKACSESLLAGMMTYNPITKKVCAHLSNDSSPGSASYFRIPYYSAAFAMAGDNTDNITFRANPTGNGSLTLTRFRDSIFTMDPSINQGITINGLIMSWAANTAISSSGTDGAASYKFINNTISHMGQMGINWSGDTGMAVIQYNTISDIGLAADFEKCSGVGLGCATAYSADPIGIKVNNCVAVDSQVHGVIQYNTIHHIGNGRAGYARGIAMLDCTYGNLVDGNLIYSSWAWPTGFYGIMFTGIPTGQYHDTNIVSNNRCEDVDHCFGIDFDTATSQATRCNDVIGNTCFQPLGSCWAQLDGAGVGGKFRFQNNLASITDNYTKLMDVASSTMWSNTFTNNGFECSHACCSGQTIATIQGNNYQTATDCTPATDCIEDLGNQNIYGGFVVQAGSLEIIEGSDAVDRGVNLANLKLDYAGTPRPIGALSDIGAHEFFGESPPFDINQSAYRFYNRFAQDRIDPLALESITPPLIHSSQFNLRFAVYGDESNTSESVANLSPYYQHCNPSCGSWTSISTDCTGTPICLVDNPFRENDESIQSDLALDTRNYSSGSRYIDNTTSVSLVFRSDDQIELELSLGLGTTMATGNVLSIRLQKSNGDPLSLYTATPSITAGSGYSKFDFN